MSTPTPVVYFTYFGDGRFQPLLEQCIREYKAAGCIMQAKILTDTITPVPAGLLPVVRVNAVSYADTYMRKGADGWQFDYKSCLIMGLMAHLRGYNITAVVMDCDNRIRRDFGPVVSGTGGKDFWIVPDPGQRLIVHPDFDRAVVEQSSSFMIFPPNPGVEIDLYQQLFIRSAERDHPLLEQRTWTLVNELVGPRVLHKTMSWSRVWGDEPPDTYLRHCHGAEKWE